MRAVARGLSLEVRRALLQQEDVLARPLRRRASARHVVASILLDDAQRVGVEVEEGALVQHQQIHRR
eukprot:5364178-Prymnesium_polylepis.1